MAGLDEAQFVGLLRVSHLLRDLFCRIEDHLAEFIHILEVETEDGSREPDTAHRFCVE